MIRLVTDMIRLAWGLVGPSIALVLVLALTLVIRELTTKNLECRVDVWPRRQEAVHAIG